MRQGTNRVIVRPLLGKPADLPITAPQHEIMVRGKNGGIPCVAGNMISLARVYSSQFHDPVLYLKKCGTSAPMMR